MSNETVLVAKCKADTTLVALLTGGIFANSALPETGLDRNSTATKTAFDSNGYLKPVLVVRAREGRVSNELVDVAAQYMTTRQPVEFYFLADASAGYTTITSARDRVRILLNLRGVSGAYLARLIDYQEGIRDTTLNNACLHRDTYEVSGFIG